MKQKTLIAVAMYVSIFTTACKKDDTTTSPTMKTFIVNVDLAYDPTTQPNPACFIDFDEGKAYKVSEGAANASKIDGLYLLRYAIANDPIIVSPGSYDGSPGYVEADWKKADLLMQNWGTYNHTIVTDGASKHTSTGFAAIKTVNDFNAWLDDGLKYTTSDFYFMDNTHIGNIYLFKTHQNKNGAFKLINAQNGSTGFATLEIKIQP